MDSGHIAEKYCIPWLWPNSDMPDRRNKRASSFGRMMSFKSDCLKRRRSNSQEMEEAAQEEVAPKSLRG